MIQLFTPITFIQGDSYLYTVSFKNIDYSTIERVIFSCIALDINQEMTPNDAEESFTYYFAPATTVTWVPLETTFDIMVELSDGKVESQTGIPLIIRKRLNDMDNPTPPGPGPTVVYWSQIRNIPEAVQAIVMTNVEAATDYNITKLNHIIFSTSDATLTVGENSLSLANSNSISWTGNTITLNNNTYNIEEIQTILDDVVALKSAVQSLTTQVDNNALAITVLQGKTTAATDADIDELFDEE